MGASSHNSTFDQPLHLQKLHFDRLKNSIHTLSPLIAINGTQLEPKCRLLSMSSSWANPFSWTKPNSSLLMPGEGWAIFWSPISQKDFTLLNANLLTCRQNSYGMGPGQLMDTFYNYLNGGSPFSLPLRSSRRRLSGFSFTTSYGALEWGSARTHCLPVWESSENQ